MKRKGKLILATINRDSLLRRLGLISKRPKKYAGEVKIFSIDEIKDLLMKEGFLINKMISADFMPMPLSLSSNIIFVASKI